MVKLPKGCLSCLERQTGSSLAEIIALNAQISTGFGTMLDKAFIQLSIECTMQDNAFVEQCIQCTMHSESCVYKSRLQCKLHCVCCGIFDGFGPSMNNCTSCNLVFGLSG